MTSGHGHGNAQLMPYTRKDSNRSANGLVCRCIRRYKSASMLGA